MSQPYNVDVPPAPAPKIDGFAIAAMIFGLVGGWLALVFGPIALRRIRKNGTRGRGMAITGMVSAGIWIAFIVAVNIGA